MNNFLKIKNIRRFLWLAREGFKNKVDRLKRIAIKGLHRNECDLGKKILGQMESWKNNGMRKGNQKEEKLK